QIVACQDASLQGRQHRLVEPDDRWEQWLATGQPGQQVPPELFLDRPVPMARVTQLADRARPWQRLRQRSTRVPGNDPTGSRDHGRTSACLLACSAPVGNNE